MCTAAAARDRAPEEKNRLGGQWADPFAGVNGPDQGGHREGDFPLRNEPGALSGQRTEFAAVGIGCPGNGSGMVGRMGGAVLGGLPATGAGAMRDFFPRIHRQPGGRGRRRAGVASEQTGRHARESREPDRDGGSHGDGAREWEAMSVHDVCLTIETGRAFCPAVFLHSGESARRGHSPRSSRARSVWYFASSSASRAIASAE